MASPQKVSVPTPTTPTLGKLNVSNHLLGDRAALQQAWERDGYWYFKGVLDKEVIGEMRKIWIDYLHRLGLIDPHVQENRYNGSSTLSSKYFEPGAEGRLAPDSLSRIDEFNRRNLHKLLTENPKINATMKQILGDDPFWLPIAEYRANPPGYDPTDPNGTFDYWLPLP